MARKSKGKEKVVEKVPSSSEEYNPLSEEEESEEVSLCEERYESLGDFGEGLQYQGQYFVQPEGSGEEMPQATGGDEPGYFYGQFQGGNVAEEEIQEEEIPPLRRERRSKKKEDPKGKGIDIGGSTARKRKASEKEKLKPGHDDFWKKAPTDTHLHSHMGTYKIYQKIKDKEVVPGANLVLADVRHWGFDEYFAHQGWTEFMQLDTLTVVDAIPYFYSNIQIGIGDESLPTIHSFFQNIQIQLTPQILGEILRVPAEGLDVGDFNLDSFEDYPEGITKNMANAFLHSNPSIKTLHSVQAQGMYTYCRLFTHILHCTVFSKTNRGEYSACEKLVAFLVLNKIRVNLPQLILRRIVNRTKVHGHLNYGKVITLILNHFGADFSAFLDNTLVAPEFGAERIRRMHITQVAPRPSLLQEDHLPLAVIRPTPTHLPHSSSARAPSPTPAGPSGRAFPYRRSSSARPSDEERFRHIVREENQALETRLKRYFNKKFHKISRLFQRFACYAPSPPAP